MSKAITTNKPIHSGKKALSSQEKMPPNEEQGQYVESFPGPIDKYVQQYIISGKIIPIGIMLVAVVLVLIQDNREGRLQTRWGWFWFILKCFFLIFLYLIYCASRRVLRFIKKRHGQATRREP